MAEMELKEARGTPKHKKHKIEQDFQKDRIIDYLEGNNKIMVDKMKTLMQLTTDVI